MPDFSPYIDLYCERTAAGVMNEPLNAISNASFVLAAWWNWRLHRAQESLVGFSTLCVLASLIGIGSFAFHTVPNTATQWLDVGAIWGFVVTLVVLLVHLATGFRWRYTGFFIIIGVGALILLYEVTGDALTANPSNANTDAFNGSLQYLPAFLALLVFSGLVSFYQHPAARNLWWAAALFSIALLFRTVDRSVCSTVPVGTHFLWHLLMGVTVGVLLRGYRVASARSQQAECYGDDETQRQ